MNTFIKESWEVREVADAILVLTQTDTGHVIAVTHEVDSGWTTRTEDALAIAHLIAAAPDLLAAAEYLLADRYLADPINQDRMAAIRAAVAKAKGAA